jgi:hypothetical protein
MQESIFRSAVKSGLILGALFSLRFLLHGFGTNWITGISRWVLVAFIVVAIWKLLEQFRDNENEGFISYGKSLGFTMLSFLYASIISAVVKIVYFVFISKEFLEILSDAMFQTLEQGGAQVTTEIEQAVAFIFSPVFWSFLVILGNMFLGLIVGLIISAIVQKEKSIFEE